MGVHDGWAEGRAAAGRCDLAALVRRAQGGDAEVFSGLVEAHQAALVRFCVRLAGDPGAAEDLVQETLLRAQQAPPRLEVPERFGA